MKSLKELQDEFQRGILAGADTILAAVNDSAKEQKKILFGVYRNAYVAPLAEILGEDYEQVHAYLGDQGFARLVKSYIAANPSDQRSTRRWFGRHLSAYVRGSTAYAKHAEVAELTELEKSLAAAFDGPDAEPLTLASLADVEPEAWPRLVFYAPSDSNTPHLRNQRGRCLDRAQERERSTETHSPAERQALIVWRQDFMARFRPLSTEEAMMWDEAAKGVRFGVLCEMVGPSLARTAPSSAPRLISRVGSTRGC